MGLSRKLFSLGLLALTFLPHNNARASLPSTVEGKIKYLQDFFVALDADHLLDDYLDAVGVFYQPGTPMADQLLTAMKQSADTIGIETSLAKPVAFGAKNYDAIVAFRATVDGQDVLARGKWHELSHLAQDWAGYSNPNRHLVEVDNILAMKNNPNIWGKLSAVQQRGEAEYAVVRKTLADLDDGLAKMLNLDVMVRSGNAGTVRGPARFLRYARIAGSKSRHAMLSVGKGIKRIRGGRLTTLVGAGFLIDYGIRHAVQSMGGHECLAEFSGLIGAEIGVVAVEHYVFGAAWMEAFGTSAVAKGSFRYSGAIKGTSVVGLSAVIVAGIHLNMMAYEVNRGIYARINEPGFNGFTPEERDAWMAHPSRGWQYAKDATAGYMRALGRTYGDMLGLR